MVEQVTTARTTDEVTPLFDNLLLFARTLRRAGLPLSPGQTLQFVRALPWIDLGEREQVFHTARSLLVFRREDLALFELVFDRFWRQAADPARRPQKAPRAPRSSVDDFLPIHNLQSLEQLAECLHNLSPGHTRPAPSRRAGIHDHLHL